MSNSSFKSNVDKQRELESVLNELSLNLIDDNDISTIESIVSKLKAIYSNGFRHKYASFFSIISNMKNDEGKLDFLSTNLDLLDKYVTGKYIKDKNENNFRKNIYKLSDHISLEIGRSNYYSKQENKLSALESKSIDLIKKITIATSQLGKAERKINTLQTELIAVLSIFAAIITVFSGSFNFIGGALAEITEANTYKSVLFISLCGMVVFNAIFLMMYLTSKIIGRSIYASCKTENCTCDKKCSSVTRIKNRLPYIFWFNVLLALIMLIDVACWKAPDIIEFAKEHNFVIITENHDIEENRENDGFIVAEPKAQTDATNNSETTPSTTDGV